MNAIRWSRGEWRAVCATFRIFEQRVENSRGLEYVDTRIVSASARVSMTVARTALNKLVDAGVLYRQGMGSVLYRYRKANRRGRA